MVSDLERCIKYLDDGDYQKAIDCLDKQITKNPNNIEALYLTGSCYYEMNDFNSAIKYFDKALKIDPTYIDVLNDKGATLLGLNEFEEAKKCLDKALSINPKLEVSWFNKGLAHFDLDEYEDAIKCFNETIKLDPEYSDAYYFKAWSQEIIDEYDDALKSYDDAINLQKDNSDYLTGKGRVLNHLKKYKDSIILFDKALRIDDQNVLALFNKGDALSELGKTDQAIKCIKKSVELNPELDFAWNYLGYLYGLKGENKKAIDCYDQAIKISPDFDLAWLNKAIILKESNKLKEALKCVEETIELNPEYPEAWYQKGNILRIQKKDKESINAYQLFIDLVERNDIKEWKLVAKRVKEYLRIKKEGEEVKLSPPEKPQHWQWVTKPEFYINPDGTDNIYLSPEYDPEPGSNWTCHKDTRIGDLILLYRAGKKNGVTYQDIKYLIQAQSDAYTLDYDEQAFEHGWQYGCDYKPLYKFENSISYHELKEDPYLEDWGALRKRFQGIAFKTEERHWKRLEELLIERNPEYKDFLKSFKPKEVVDTFISEKNLERELSKNLDVLKRFGYNLKLVGRQVRCIGQGGRIDLLCEDIDDKSLVIIELKIVKATRNTFGQISNYLGWAIRNKADGKDVRGIVISKGYDNEFDSTLITNDKIEHIELADVMDRLGMKIKY